MPLNSNSVSAFVDQTIIYNSIRSGMLIPTRLCNLCRRNISILQIHSHKLQPLIQPHIDINPKEP